MINMEKKEWSLYTQDEKEALLGHWLHYFGAAIVTGKDLIKFDILAKEYTEDIYRVAINGYINNMNATVLVMSIRSNCVDKLFKKAIKKVELNDAQKEIYESYEHDFIDMLVDSYNDPKAPVPLSEDQIIEQLGPILIKRSMQK